VPPLLFVQQPVALVIVKIKTSKLSFIVAFDDLPEAERKGLPHYPVPTFHLARMAVDEKFRGKNLRLGELLLFHARRRAKVAADAAGLYAVEVVAKDADAAGFYGKYAFQSLVDDPLHMYLPMSTVKKMFAE